MINLLQEQPLKFQSCSPYCNLKIIIEATEAGIFDQTLNLKDIEKKGFGVLLYARGDTVFS